MTEYHYYHTEFYIYAADMAEFNRKYERMRQVAEERGRLLEELASRIVQVAARVDEELERRREVKT